MKWALKLAFFGIILFNLVLSSWFVLHQDIEFTSDIARDFHLLREIDEKKIILIGPRSTTGLFHGPLWLYLNYPAYKIGNGNPLVVGWWWIVLIILFLISNFIIAKKLFNETTGYFFVLMTSVFMMFHAKGLYNPHGALFFLPVFFYFFIRYIQTLKITYLITHIFFAAILVQFQLSIGIPFTLLSFIAIAYISYKKNKKRHILFSFLIVIPLLNFLIFDIRHTFLLLHTAIQSFSPISNGHIFNYFMFLNERFQIFIAGAEIFRVNIVWNRIALFLLFFLIYRQVKDNTHKIIYLSFLYFYVGFFIVSFIHKAGLVYFYVYPIFPLVFLIFSSFVTSKKYKELFVFIFFVIFAINLQTAINDTQASNEFMGKNQDSWKFLFSLSSKVFEKKDDNFGYFVYSPDVLGYEPKYAMLYAAKLYNKSIYRSVKKPITYLIIAPSPSWNPYMKDEWWRKYQVRISSEPVETIAFDNGYKIEKFLLTDEETKVTFDHAIDPGLHFR